MNKPTRFAVTALAVFVLVIGIGVLASPTQALSLAIYIMLGIVFAPTVAYFFVYLGGFSRTNSDVSGHRSGPSADRAGADDSAGSPPETDGRSRE